MSGLFQNCDPDDDEPMVTYHCPPENFTNDCNAYEGIGSSTGFGYTGKRAESITFVPGNSNQILFTEWDGDDASIPAKMVLYDWYSKVREVLVEETPMLYDYDITDDRLVCAKKLGPIIYFHLDSAFATVQEVPFDGEVIKDPVWLSDGETIVYMSDSHDLDFKLYSYNVKNRVKARHDVLAENVTNLLIPSMSKTDHFVVFLQNDGFYKMWFHDLNRLSLLIEHKNTAPYFGGGRGMYLKGDSRIYYAGHWDVNIGENNHQYMVRDICFSDEQIQCMDVSDDEKFIVYMFDSPLKLQGGVQIRGSKIRVIDIENCKEYEINPFE